MKLYQTDSCAEQESDSKLIRLRWKGGKVENVLCGKPKMALALKRHFSINQYCDL